MGNARPDRVAAKTEGMALALVAAALWGLAPVATKAALEGYSPEALAVIRLGVAGSLFRLLAGPGAPWLPRERWSLVAGLALGVDFLLYNYGLRHTTAAVAGLVVNIEVISTIALAHWLLGERLTPRRLCGAAVAVAGVIAVALDGTSLEGLMARGRLFGNGCVMLAAMTWSVYAVCQRRATARTGGGRFEILAPIFSVATLTMLPGLLAPAARVNPAGVLPTTMLAALTLLCTVGVYLLYTRCQQLLAVNALAVVLTTIPVFAVTFAALFLGEPVTPPILLGGTAIVAGVLLIATEPAPALVAA